MSKEYFIKLVILGYGEVGKSEIMKQLISEDVFKELHQYDRVSFFDLTSKDKIFKFTVLEPILRPDLRKAKANYSYVKPVFYSGTHIILLVFDITDQNSFENVKDWYLDLIEHFQELGETLPQFIVIGNKVDRESERKVSKDAGKQYVKDINARYIEISAREKVGLEILNESLIETCLRIINQK